MFPIRIYDGGAVSGIKNCNGYYTKIVWLPLARHFVDKNSIVGIRKNSRGNTSIYYKKETELTRKYRRRSVFDRWHQPVSIVVSIVFRTFKTRAKWRRVFVTVLVGPALVGCAPGRLTTTTTITNYNTTITATITNTNTSHSRLYLH